MIQRLIIGILIVFGALSASPGASADQTAGAVEAEVDGETVTFPMLNADYEISIDGDLVNVRLRQTFANPLEAPVHATYLFPLNKGAAVHRMRMEVGDEVIVARIQRKQEAEKTFQKAKSEGKAAALLRQHRPNMFTQKIANLMPGLPIVVEIAYTHVAAKVDGEYEVVVPLVVGPRYESAENEAGGHGGQDQNDVVSPVDFGVHPAVMHTDDLVPHEAGPAGMENGVTATTVPATPKAKGLWHLVELPTYPSVFGLGIPRRIDPDRVAVTVRMRAGSQIVDAYSETHALAIQRERPEVLNATFAEGRVIDNRDFVLRYALAGTDTTAGLLTHWADNSGYFSLLIEPPALPDEALIVPREMVFVLDCSGSMAGLPMSASKEFMRAALSGLRPTDSFRIIRFSDAATEFSTQPLPATPENVRSGIRYTNALAGSGGTVMMSGIQQALMPPVPEGAIRNVVFLTDGYIGNEAEILRVLQTRLNDARLFAFGVGTGVNRYLLDEMARVGRGFVRYFDPTSESAEMRDIANGLAERLQSPVLADIEIDWGGLPVTDLTLEQVPDLYAGESIRVQGRYEHAARGDVVISGRTGASKAVLTLPLELTREPTSSSIAFVWARERVAYWMRELIAPEPVRVSGYSDERIKDRVTSLGLRHRLVTRWTSFVAVSERVYNPSADTTPDASVPLPMVKGVAASAYPASAFTGYAAPEPPLVLTSLLLALIAGAKVWMRRRRDVATA